MTQVILFTLIYDKVSMMNKVWINNYNKLHAYFTENGHFAILLSDRSNKRLRHWFQSQIHLYKRNKLTHNEKELFNSLNVDLTLCGPKWENWERSYRKLAIYFELNGHSSASQLIKGVGPWLSAQRVLYRRHELSDTKTILLQNLEVVWNPSEKHQDNWQVKFEKVKAFYEKNGHCNVPRRDCPDPGIWVSAQRTAYRKELLSPNRIKALNSINFQWKLR